MKLYLDFIKAAVRNKWTYIGIVASVISEGLSIWGKPAKEVVSWPPYLLSYLGYLFIFYVYGVLFYELSRSFARTEQSKRQHITNVLLYYLKATGLLIAVTCVVVGVGVAFKAILTLFFASIPGLIFAGLLLAAFLAFIVFIYLGGAAYTLAHETHKGSISESFSALVQMPKETLLVLVLSILFPVAIVILFASVIRTLPQEFSMQQRLLLTLLNSPWSYVLMVPGVLFLAKTLQGKTPESTKAGP